MPVDPSVAVARELNAAALTGSVEKVKALLRAGVDPDAKSPSHEQYRPLHRALEHRGVPKNPGHRKVIELLLEAGADLEARATWMQLPPLAVAGMAGEREFIELLLDRAAPLNVFTAAAIADAKSVLKFLKKAPSLAKAKDENQMTVLHYAAVSNLAGENEEKSYRAIANALLDAGADGDSREQIGPFHPTPVLHFAAWGNYALAETLLSRGCNPNYGFTNCLWKPPGRMAELFRAHGADANGREHCGQPYLHSRIHWNLPSVVLWLLKHGADPNGVDKDGNAPLHQAAMRGINLEVVAAILEKGGHTGTKNKKGETALDIARAKKRTKIVAFLEKAV